MPSRVISAVIQCIFSVSGEWSSYIKEKQYLNGQNSEKQGRGYWVCEIVVTDLVFFFSFTLFFGDSQHANALRPCKSKFHLPVALFMTVARELTLPNDYPIAENCPLTQFLTTCNHPEAILKHQLRHTV